MKLQIRLLELNADLHSPVGIFLQLRGHFPELLLLESNDYQQHSNSYSFICAERLAEISLQQGILKRSIGQKQESLPLAEQGLATLFSDFIETFHCDKNVDFNGLYGHCNFDAVQYFDSPSFDPQKQGFDIPDFRYGLYRFIIAIHHHSQQMLILENCPEGEASQLSRIEQLLQRPVATAFPFHPTGEAQSPLRDEDFRTMVRQAKAACARGDVFQLVLSRRFSQAFIGDEFQVYRALRRINPSPYLFYFDYGDYKLFGSSPEAQLLVKKQKALLMPIAGTYRRGNSATEDQVLAEQLLADPKENAEHVMLVDLARNDLNRHCQNVQLEQYRTVQYFSHVLHLVSKVSGQIREEKSFPVFADCFPAGTLSGAPKYKALSLIDHLEPHRRSFYGGSIGCFAFNGDVNQAILIRSFLSYEQALHYQAGAGIVMDSEEEKELQEIYNKLAALNKAIQLAAQQHQN